MLGRIGCWLGLHAWGYEREHSWRPERACYRCSLREAPWETTIEEPEAIREAA